MKDKDVLFISVATLITALAWVVFDAYHAYTTSTIPKELEEIALPITPIIDTNIVQSLKSRTEPVFFVNQNETVTLPLAATNSAKAIQ